MRARVPCVAIEELTIELKAVDSGLPVPFYEHADDAGADLYSAEDFTLQPFERRLVGTGIAIALPEGFAAFVHPRSGLSIKHGITVVNAPGTIDAGYRGEIKVPLVNLDATAPFVVSRGDRIAQLVIQRVVKADFTVVDVLSSTVRGEGGFGSTGGFSAQG
ncbi:dUTP diphosphatase [Brevibacterium samyangense]|uniref:dUTP diphosphatase n=1 Tax=Brevibacterium samyangense TaxID=366888 RepID=UPI003CD059F8